MIVLVIGNIGSGKTTLIEKIRDRDSKFVSIDKLRYKHSDGSFSQELSAWSEFLKICEGYSSTTLFLEFSGAGPHKHAVRQALINSKNKILVVYNQTPLQICNDRIQSKSWKTPYPWEQDPVEALEPVHSELEQDQIDEFWVHERFNFITIDGTKMNEECARVISEQKGLQSSEKSSIDFNEDYGRLTQNKIVERLRTLGLQYPSFEAMLQFGSVLTNTMTWRSDVDLAVISNDYDGVISIIKEQFSPWIIHDLTYENRSLLYFTRNGDYPPIIIKLDLYIVSKVKEISRYIINKVNIEDVGTDLIIFDKTGYTTLFIKNNIEQLTVKNVTDQHVNKFTEYFELMSRTHFYGDQYRYYFYLNLVFHQVICLNHILTNKTEDHFLPKFTFSDYEFNVEKEFLPKMEPVSNPRIGNKVKKDYIDEFIGILARLNQKYDLGYDIEGLEEFLMKIRLRDYFWNYRDISMVCSNHIKQGVLYRTSTLSRYRGDKELDDLLERLGINGIIDLRYEKELDKYPYDNFFDDYDITYISCPVEPDKGLKNKPMKYMNGTENYYELFPRYMMYVVRSIFQALIEVPIPAAIHCYVGRDRTGMIIAMLQKFLGCTDQQVIQDYLNSNMNTTRDTILRTLLVIEEKGGIREYLHDTGLDKQQLTKLENRFRR